MSRRRKVRPAVFTIRPDSTQLRLRLAALLAYQSLPRDQRNRFYDQAEELLRLMKNARI